MNMDSVKGYADKAAPYAAPALQALAAAAVLTKGVSAAGLKATSRTAVAAGSALFVGTSCVASRYGKETAAEWAANTKPVQFVREKVGTLLDRPMAALSVLADFSVATALASVVWNRVIAPLAAKMPEKVAGWLSVGGRNVLTQLTSQTVAPLSGRFALGALNAMMTVGTALAAVRLGSTVWAKFNAVVTTAQAKALNYVVLDPTTVATVKAAVDRVESVGDNNWQRMFTGEVDLTTGRKVVLGFVPTPTNGDQLAVVTDRGSGDAEKTFNMHGKNVMVAPTVEGVLTEEDKVAASALVNAALGELEDGRTTNGKMGDPALLYLEKAPDVPYYVAFKDKTAKT